MVLARRNLSVAAKAPIEHFTVLHLAYIDQTPSRNPPIASSAHLPTKQPDNSILNAVIVGLGKPFVALVPKSE
jgi:hypothetical protein